ncbi:MAG: ParB/RepB/Spo0J family partition protein [Patescibacteria group bacterium]
MPKGLGRGLDSLIPQKPKKTKNDKGGDIMDVTTEEERENITELDINKIKARPSQPRKEFSGHAMEELTDSVRRYGIIQPLIVTPTEEGYELIAGERRLRAGVEAGLEKVPVVVRDYDQQKQLEVALIENLQREDLTPIEKAVAYRKLMADFNMSVQDVAESVGKSRPSVSNIMRLLDLPEEIQDAILKGKLNEANALWVAGLDTEAKQMEVFRKIIHGNMTYGQVREEVKKMGGTKQARIKQDPKDGEREERLREAVGTKVKLTRKKKGGTITIDFYSDEELDGIIDKFN